MKHDTEWNTPGIKATAAVSLALVALLFLPIATAGEWTGNANLLLGQKQLDEDDWQQLDSQNELGVLVDFRKVDWPVSIAIDLIGSGDVHEVTPDKDKGYTLERHIGVRKIWDTTGTDFHPYLGGGIAIVTGKIERSIGTPTTEQDDTGAGVWLGAGTYWSLGPKLNLGLDVRYSKADITLFSQDVEAGGTHAGLFVGYHW